VIVTILAHGLEGFRPEIEIPMKYGVDFNCGDSYGTGGVPGDAHHSAMLDFCREHGAVRAAGLHAELHQPE